MINGILMTLTKKHISVRITEFNFKSKCQNQTDYRKKPHFKIDNHGKQLLLNKMSATAWTAKKDTGTGKYINVSACLNIRTQKKSHHPQVMTLPVIYKPKSAVVPFGIAKSAPLIYALFMMMFIELTALDSFCFFGS